MVDLAGSNDRRKPSLSPRKGNNHSSSASAAFRQSDGDDLLRPESASLLSQQGRRPPTFDGVSVVAVEHDATPSKRIRSNREGEASGESRSNFLHGALHLTTAVIGVGILGLPRALVDLGWPAGIAFMGVATAVSLYTALLLVELCSEGGEERGGSGSSSVGAPCPRSPPPPPEPLPPTLDPPPDSSSSSSLSIGVGRRGASVQDLPSLAESSGAPRGEPRRKRGAPTAAATGSSSASPARSSGSSRYETYGALARATLGPRVGGAVASMQLLACAGSVFRKFYVLHYFREAEGRRASPEGNIDSLTCPSLSRPFPPDSHAGSQSPTASREGAPSTRSRACSPRRRGPSSSAPPSSPSPSRRPTLRGWPGSPRAGRWRRCCTPPRPSRPLRECCCCRRRRAEEGGRFRRRRGAAKESPPHGARSTRRARSCSPSAGTLSCPRSPRPCLLRPPPPVLLLLLLLFLLLLLLLILRLRLRRWFPR